MEVNIKNFLVKTEKKLLEKITYPPDLAPQSAWFYYKLLQILLTLLIITGFPTIGILVYLTIMFEFQGIMNLLIPALMIIVFIISAYLMSELNSFKCPQCSKRFNYRKPWELDMANKACGHCGLPIWKEPDNRETIPPSEPSEPAETRSRKLNLSHLIRIVLRAAAALWIILILLVFIVESYLR